MEKFDFINFLKNIQVDIKKAQDNVDDIAHYRMYQSIENNMFDDEKNQLDELILEDSLKKCILKVKFALESLGLINLLNDFDVVIKSYKSKYTKLDYIPYIGVLVSPIMEDIQNFVDAITCQIDPELNEINNADEEKILLLERILINTPKIISDNKFEPANETEIKNAVFKILIHVFPDTVREIPISKVSKTYKPDIGIRKLKVAVEYKFADSLLELKKSIGGIFEDIKGYEGSEDWKTFYAVIYQTDHFLTQSQIDEEFKLSKVEHNWKPILVYGKGKRIAKKEKSVK